VSCSKMRIEVPFLSKGASGVGGMYEFGVGSFSFPNKWAHRAADAGCLLVLLIASDIDSRARTADLKIEGKTLDKKGHYLLWMVTANNNICDILPIFSLNCYKWCILCCCVFTHANQTYTWHTFYFPSVNDILSRGVWLRSLAVATKKCRP
jgi:hypothetical protein